MGIPRRGTAAACPARAPEHEDRDERQRVVATKKNRKHRDHASNVRPNSTKITATMVLASSAIVGVRPRSRRMRVWSPDRHGSSREDTRWPSGDFELTALNIEMRSRAEPGSPTSRRSRQRPFPPRTLPRRSSTRQHGKHRPRSPAGRWRSPQDAPIIDRGYRARDSDLFSQSRSSLTIRVRVDDGLQRQDERRRQRQSARGRAAPSGDTASPPDRETQRERDQETPASSAGW